jgi:hypothetical protein
MFRRIIMEEVELTEEEERMILKLLNAVDCSDSLLIDLSKLLSNKEIQMAATIIKKFKQKD